MKTNIEDKNQGNTHDSENANTQERFFSLFEERAGVWASLAHKNPPGLHCV